MKKLLFIVLSLILVIPVYAQSIKYIKLTDERWEFMTEEDSFYPKGQKSIYVSWQVYNDINEPNPDAKLRFFLIISYKTFDKSEVIPYGGKLLIKTCKEDIINSSNDVEGDILAYNSKSGYKDYISRHEYVSGSYSSSYVNRGKYELYLEDVTKLANDGVIKIRIETNGESIDINLPAEEQVKIGKEKHNVNKFALSAAKLITLTNRVFNPTKDF